MNIYIHIIYGTVFCVMTNWCRAIAVVHLGSFCGRKIPGDEIIH
jgi:hypothetical protein